MKKPQLKRHKKASSAKPADSRITNETVAEHREKILAGGRRFKYPHQYLRHRLVATAIIISFVVLVAVTVIGWWQLYIVQNTSDFMYRVTKVIPAPVGVVDGEQIRYSDYLVQYRSQEQWLRSTDQLSISGSDGKRQLDYLKSQTLNKLTADAYAEKKAEELGISVTNDEVQKVIDNNRNTQTGVASQDVYDASIRDVLGYSPDEYRRLIRQALITSKVMYAVDEQAKAYRSEIASALQEKKPSLEAIAKSYQDKGVAIEFGAPGPVPKNNQDGGKSATAVALRDGQISSAKESTTGDGYYFLQKVSSDDNSVSYRYIMIPLTVFEEQLKAVKSTDSVQYYISIKDVDTKFDINQNTKQ